MKKDIATTIGLILSMFFVGLGMVGFPPDMAKVAAFADGPSILIVFGGTLASVFVNFTMDDIKRIPSVIGQAFQMIDQDPVDIIKLLVEFAEKARREGLLSLEEDVEKVSNAFIKKGVQLVIDGTDPALVRDILTAEMEQVDARHKGGIKIMNCFSTFGPAFGMIGTLVGLILMLGNLSDPSSLGPAMAVALITTMYGAMLSNMITIPMERNLEVKNNMEILIYTISIQGLLSIQAGDNPRIVEERLKAYLSPAARKAMAAKTADTDED
ncbi:MAG: MotA/TolQ/ExbB proton channel family protein [Candidatus Cloacimonetes bacterium]|nr:MotA/TolQ/ExbB proton channel family protein [Candidatus Cloacimonadota bacterium]